MQTLLLTPLLDNRYGAGKVTSRIGLQAEAQTFTSEENLLTTVQAANAHMPLDCILVDEAQFLSRNQVMQLGQIADLLDIPVLAYGLRTDFQGEPFEGSKYLLALADNLKEIKAICHCGSKATMVLRQDENGRVITKGESIAIGGNDQYVSMCRKHFFEAFGASNFED